MKNLKIQLLIVNIVSVIIAIFIAIHTNPVLWFLAFAFAMNTGYFYAKVTDERR